LKLRVVFFSVERVGFRCVAPIEKWGADAQVGPGKRSVEGLVAMAERSKVCRKAF
jgi:hypothetical protein